MININRHNYEEFFLLYVDRELSAAERVAVEQFVQENPDLKEELDALNQTTLVEDIKWEMPDKAALYRTTATGINMENHLTYFLMYVDHELTTEETEAVEKFVLQHPELQELFVQFKQTQLPVENIPFPDKSLLYRSEETEKKPLVYTRWWRIAAAAAIIGFAFMIWTSLPDGLQKEADPLLSANNNSELPATNNKPSDNNVISPDQTLASIAGNSNSIAATTKNKVLSQELVVVNIPNTVIDENNSRPDLVIDKAEIMGTNSTAKAAIVMPNLTGITASNAISEEEMIKTVSTETPQDDMVQQVVYKELDTDTDSENKSLLIGSVEINKDKLRGIFRKASSIFRSKRTEEEKAETIGTGPSRPLK